MKNSHFSTPRSLGECAFYGWADPIERPQTRQVSPRTIWLGFVVALLVVGACVVVEALS